MTTPKQRLGAWLVPRLPVNPWVFRTFRVELNAVTVRLLNRILPGRIARQRALRQRTGVLVNVGCGPFGQEGWVNLDLFPAPGVTMRVDCRYPCLGVVDMTNFYKSAPVGQKVQVKMPLSCFEATGTKFTAVNTPLVIFTTKAFGLSVANVRYVPGAAKDADALKCTP